MVDSFSETTSQSWGGRLGNSIKGILFGIIIFLVGFPLLSWNEHRAVVDFKAFKEGRGAVINVATDSVQAANEGAFVHLSGKATTDETLSDAEFGVSGNAIRLVRNVEMYQWKERTEKETKKKTGGSSETTTTYHYEKVWSASAIDSNSFHEKGRAEHSNPGSIPLQGKSLQAESVTLGAFSLPANLISQISKSEKVAVDSGALKSVTGDAQEGMKAHAGMFYKGANPGQPAIGDVRISFSIVKPQDVSVLASQTGNSFGPYTTKVGKTLFMLDHGLVSADGMFAAAEQRSRIMTWVLRLVGWICMMAGIGMILKPLEVVADVLPFLGNLVGIGTGLVALLIGSSFAALTVAVAWIVVRPLIGIPLLMITAGSIIAIVVLKKKNA